MHKNLVIVESPAKAKTIEKFVGKDDKVMSSYVHVRDLKAKVAEEKAANLPQQMIENIAKGRLSKFMKEVCLLSQEDIMDSKRTVRDMMKAIDPELQILAFKRFTLRAE